MWEEGGAGGAARCRGGRCWTLAAVNRPPVAVEGKEGIVCEREEETGIGNGVTRGWRRGYGGDGLRLFFLMAWVPLEGGVNFIHYK